MGVPKFRGGGIVPVERPLCDKFLFRTLGLIHIYQNTKYQLPSSSSFGDREGVKKVGVQSPLGCSKIPLRVTRGGL